MAWVAALQETIGAVGTAVSTAAHIIWASHPAGQQQKKQAAREMSSTTTHTNWARPCMSWLATLQDSNLSSQAAGRAVSTAPKQSAHH
jgi:hypothetical protein